MLFKLADADNFLHTDYRDKQDYYPVFMNVKKDYERDMVRIKLLAFLEHNDLKIQKDFWYHPNWVYSSFPCIIFKDSNIRNLFMLLSC